MKLFVPSYLCSHKREVEAFFSLSYSTKCLSFPKSKIGRTTAVNGQYFLAKIVRTFRTHHCVAYRQYIWWVVKEEKSSPPVW